MAATDAAGRTVSSQLLYNLNPSAIQSSVHLKTINCDGTNTYAGGLNSKIVFTIPHIPGGEYWDPSMSRFRCVFRLHAHIRREKNTTTNQYECYDNDRTGEVDHPIAGSGYQIPQTKVAPQNTLSTCGLNSKGFTDAIRLERGVESIIRYVIMHCCILCFETHKHVIHINHLANMNVSFELE